MNITPQQISLALSRAADWLEANPDKHITHFLAKNDNGNSTDPTDPSATCFCALGRFAHEAADAGLGVKDYSSVYDKHIPIHDIWTAWSFINESFEALGRSWTEVSEANDASATYRKTRAGNVVGTPPGKVIALLREISKEAIAA